MGVPRRPEWPRLANFDPKLGLWEPRFGGLRPPIEGLGGPDPRSGASNLASQGQICGPKTDFPSGGPNFGLQRRPKRR